MKLRVAIASMFAAVLTLPMTTKATTGAAAPCVFNTSGTTMTLTADCTTDVSLMVPDGFTMDLNGFTVVAIDPSGGHFLGAVIRNAGASAVVRNGVVTTSNLANVCDAGNDRLRGVMFDGASGRITDMTVDNINQGASGCQEGNAIEVRNFPLTPNLVQVQISGNVLVNWQKTGIVVNGEVDASVHHNVINASATQANLAANSLQIGFGAKALVEHNHIAGNSWGGASDTVSTSILMFQSAAGTVVRQNNLMDGNSDVGIYVFADGVTVDNNKVFESGPDTNQFGYDIGVGNYGFTNSITNNKTKGYGTPYDGVTSGKNKDVPAPSKQ